MLVQYVSKVDFREDLSPHFSYEACNELFEFYDELEGDDHTIYDPVAIRCEWTEYDSVEELLLDLWDNSMMRIQLNLDDLSEHSDRHLRDALDEIGEFRLVLRCSNGHVLIGE